MPHLSDWYFVRFDDQAIALEANPPNGTPWQETVPWSRIIRVCFQAGDWFESDTIYIFTDHRPESYVIPTESAGGQELWFEILRRKLFDAEMAIQAATAANELFCSPPY